MADLELMHGIPYDLQNTAMSNYWARSQEFPWAPMNVAPKQMIIINNGINNDINNGLYMYWNSPNILLIIRGDLWVLLFSFVLESHRAKVSVSSLNLDIDQWTSVKITTVSWL